MDPDPAFQAAVGFWIADTAIEHVRRAGHAVGDDVLRDVAREMRNPGRR